MENHMKNRITENQNSQCLSPLWLSAASHSHSRTNQKYDQICHKINTAKTYFYVRKNWWRWSFCIFGKDTNERNYTWWMRWERYINWLAIHTKEIRQLKGNYYDGQFKQPTIYCRTIKRSTSKWQNSASDCKLLRKHLLVNCYSTTRLECTKPLYTNHWTMTGSYNPYTNSSIKDHWPNS